MDSDDVITTCMQAVVTGPALSTAAFPPFPPPSRSPLAWVNHELLFNRA